MPVWHLRAPVRQVSRFQFGGESQGSSGPKRSPELHVSRRDNGGGPLLSLWSSRSEYTTCGTANVSARGFAFPQRRVQPCIQIFRLLFLSMRTQLLAHLRRPVLLRPLPEGLVSPHSEVLQSLSPRLFHSRNCAHSVSSPPAEKLSFVHVDVSLDVDHVGPALLPHRNLAAGPEVCLVHLLHDAPYRNLRLRDSRDFEGEHLHVSCVAELHSFAAVRPSSWQFAATNLFFLPTILSVGTSLSRDIGHTDSSAPLSVVTSNLTFLVFCVTE